MVIYYPDMILVRCTALHSDDIMVLKLPSVIFWQLAFGGPFPTLKKLWGAQGAAGGSKLGGWGRL